MMDSVRIASMAVSHGGISRYSVFTGSAQKHYGRKKRTVKTLSDARNHQSHQSRNLGK